MSLIRLLPAWIALAVAPGCAAGADDVRKTAEAVARDLDVQQALPKGSAVNGDSEQPPSVRWFPEGLEGPAVSAPAAVWTIVEWAIVAVAVITIVAWLGIWIAETYQRRTQGDIPRAMVGSGGGEAAPLDPAQALAQADAWAAAGHYGPAMHQVWLAAVAMLAHRLDARAPDSLTSWELLRAASLQADERQALGDVVQRVNRAWFGKQPAGLEDYRAVRGSYQEFVAGSTHA